MTAESHYVPFRLIHMQCCRTLICWVNSRRPNYCPECGENIFRFVPKARWEATFSPAWLKVDIPDSANYITDMFSIKDEYKVREDDNRQGNDEREPEQS